MLAQKEGNFTLPFRLALSGEITNETDERKQHKSYQDVSKDDFAKYQEHQAEELDRKRMDDVQRNVKYRLCYGWRI